MATFGVSAGLQGVQVFWCSGVQGSGFRCLGVRCLGFLEFRFRVLVFFLSPKAFGPELKNTFVESRARTGDPRTPQVEPRDDLTATDMGNFQKRRNIIWSMI